MPSIERGGGTRVLLVADSLDVGGAERHVVNLAAELVRSGWSVTIACSVAGGLATEASAAGVEVCPLIGSLVKRSVSLPYAWRLAHLTRRGHVGLIHAHMFASSVAAGMAARLTQLPLVITEHSEANWRSPRARWFSRRAYTITARIIAVCSGTPPTALATIGIPADMAMASLSSAASRWRFC